MYTSKKKLYNLPNIFKSFISVVLGGRGKVFQVDMDMEVCAVWEGVESRVEEGAGKLESCGGGGQEKKL